MEVAFFFLFLFLIFPGEVQVCGVDDDLNSGKLWSADWKNCLFLHDMLLFARQVTKRPGSRTLKVFYLCLTP